MTIVMQQAVSKSQFKSQVLEYLRAVEKSKLPLVITHEGKPVVKVIPYRAKVLLNLLRKTVLYFEKPDKPVASRDWEVLK